MPNDPLLTVLFSIFDLLWIAAFVLIIRRGFKDNTFGMPVIAAIVNLTWDAVVSFVYPAPAPQVYFEVLFAAFDMVILYQVFKHWRREFPSLAAGTFYAFVGLAFVTAVALILGVRFEFKDLSSVYSGYAGNLMGSILFVGMLINRSDLRGQSLYIALAKWLGTGAASLGSVIFQLPNLQGDVLVPILCAGMFVFDLTYVILVYRKSRALGINPWTRG
ncbi:MAG TPA: hypothetical protein VJ754_08495 [Anaerolineae bacterium]|nr:hypothetical protein [Anaerolineae bacterium]